MPKEARYQPLVDREYHGQNLHRSSSRQRWMAWLTHAILLSMSLGFLISSLWIRSTAPGNSCSDRESIYSPALEAVKTQVIRLNGSFNYESVYKGTPSPKLDKAWSKVAAGDILPGPLISISKEQLVRIGQAGDIDAVVQFPPEKGGGYVASIEVFHQLHCLNMLRQISYPEYYQRNSDPDKINRKHIDHCIDMLRQHLMCRADTGIVTGRWVKGYGHLYPYFSTLHVCRDFEAIYEWADQRRVNVSQDESKKYRGSVSLDDIP